MSESEEYLTLKWGSLKSWKINNEKAFEAFKKWNEIGVSASAMCHHDTPEQKELICEIIDNMDIEGVCLAYDGKMVSKEEAKKYVMEYGNKKVATT